MLREPAHHDYWVLVGTIEASVVRLPQDNPTDIVLLLEALEKYAGGRGYKWLYLDTAADMGAAARFYQRKGFQDCARYNQNPQAAIFMRKAIV